MSRVVLVMMVTIWTVAACEQTTDFPAQGSEDITPADGVDGVDGVDGEDSTPLPDTPSPDLAPPDAEPPGCEPGTGCFGEPCQESDDCLSGLCGEHLGDGACTKTCEDVCPAGWSCEQVLLGGVDPAHICVSNHTFLCRPCGETGDCASDAGEDACVSYGSEGWFCGASCGDAAPCPEGFACEERETTGGGLSSQCVALSGVCACSLTASNLGLSTPCEVENQHGTCEGVRSCGAEGLGSCDATEPQAELCNGVDDDCDGDVDTDTCEDGNPCTVDACLGAEGCSFEPLEGGDCVDDDVCTEGDVCVAGACLGEPIDCDDGNPCTDDGCDPIAGCTHVPNFADCSDGDPCTHGDACKAGTCAPGGLLACDDGNPCTDDLCDETAGCLFQPHEGDCDDGNLCTSGDSCVEATCLGAASTDCDDENACTYDNCEPATGCAHAPHTLPCNDNDVCTVGDHCLDGACDSGGTLLGCDDGNPCTSDTCDPADGCAFAPNGEACDDGSDCTSEDVCSGGTCVGQGALDCDDGNPCTHDLCGAAGGCAHEPTSGPCFDGDLCTVGDVCDGGVCLSGGPQDCDDGNPCTDDVCSAAGLCVHTANDGPCDDGNACTDGDACATGACLGLSPVDCSDGNPCTLDSCAPLGGCTHQNQVGPCDDGDACTVGDVCAQGGCVPGSALLCEDYNACTENLCDALAGCQFPGTGGDCEDGNPCTAEDTCVAGGCVGQVVTVCEDGNPCTTDSCEGDSGCVHTPNAAPCDDGNLCTPSDVCAAGACLGSGQIDCDDQDVCTTDLCVPASGCEHSFNASGCDDGSACTLVDTCTAGQCEGVGAPDCDDENPCTDDGCDVQLGCVHEDNSLPCNDGEICTTSDVCGGGVCLGAGALDCDDGNACTDDLCVVGEGCSNPWFEGECDDGDACTAGQDICSDGQCLGGAPLVCDDGNPCTDDQCDANAGCQFPAVTEIWLGMCSDGDACTENDFCVELACLGSPVTVDPPGAPVGPTEVCDGEAGVVYHVSGVPGATEYLWTVPAGVEITAGQGSATITTTWSAGASGLVSASSANACDQSDPSSIDVVTQGCLATDLIIGWSGLLNEIPPGWNLCDGSGGTPDFRDRFAKGTPDGMLAGIVGGSSGAHDHGGVPEGTLTTTSADPAGRSCSGNSCTWKAYKSAHSHSLDHSHTVTLTSELPPYYELIFLQNISASSLPAGAITLWVDGDGLPPGGWSVCDGLGAGPDLRGHFMRGAGWGEGSGEVGGSATHGHGDKTDSETHVGAFNNGKQTVGCFGVSATDGDHNHSFNHDHTVDNVDHLPPYMNVDFLHADGVTAAAAGHILMWSGDLGAIPDGWALCDGAEGRPDLRDRFPRGAEDGEALGSTGGTSAHAHGSSTDPGGNAATNGGGNGGCGGGSTFMDFHDHTVNAHSHPDTAPETHEPPYWSVHYIIKI